MKPFYTVAVPHDDVIEGKLTNEVFAADLWEVYKGNAPVEYRDREEFFRKTFITKGLKNLLEVVESRLRGNWGDPVIQIQTPFGGGKTHSLIALYHKAGEWKVRRVVIAGTALSGKVRLWELMEEQLTGRVELLKGDTSPGREKIQELLNRVQPVLILMDEVLEYITKAAGIKIGESTLAAQTLAFLQELTEAVSNTQKAALVLTLPSSSIEHYDAWAERAYEQLKKISGRLEKIYTPVDDEEISQVIRRRLFSSIDEEEMKEIVNQFIVYAERENILPANLEPSEYRRLFENSYPFLPEVIDVLYQRWGSFPSFQRTRGVLRLLAMVIQTNKNKNTPYISLADFDLSNQNIRRELLEFIGNEYDSVIASDITSETSGAKRVDSKLGDSYRLLNLGTRTATAIFMYSFSGGKEKGATKREIKRAATTVYNPASIIGEVLDELKSNLFFLQSDGEKYFFTNRPNLNRIVLTKMENLTNEEVETLEKELLKNFAGSALKTYIWTENPQDVPDTPDLKLVILKEYNQETAEQILSMKGSSPRIYRNTLFFLLPVEVQKTELSNLLRKAIAYKHTLEDKTLNLTKTEIAEIKKNLKELEKEYNYHLRNVYRFLLIPAKDGFKEKDLGTSIYGDNKKISEEVFEVLINEGEILKKLSSIVLEHKYLKTQTYVRLSDIFDASLKTRGEVRFLNLEVLIDAVKEGTKQGIFGIGREEKGKIVCEHIESEPEYMDENFLIIERETCKANLRVDRKNREETTGKDEQTLETREKSELNYGQENKEETQGQYVLKDSNNLSQVNLAFRLPKGNALEIGRLLNILDLYFEEIEIIIKATNGKISRNDYENKIEETLRQLGISVNTIKEG